MATWEFRHEAGKGVIALAGTWLARSGEAPPPEVGRLCRRAAVQRVSFEVSRLGRWDTLLVAFLWDVKRAAAAAGVALDDAALPQSAKQLLRLLPSRATKQLAAPQAALPLLARLGTRSIDFLAEAGANATLAATVAVGGARLLLGRARVRAVDFVTYLLDAGPRAWAVVGVVNFLIGAVLAYIGAAELRPFGAEDYVPSLTAVAAVREISSVMTAIVMAGRTGGAYAARIASMKGNDEIAALETAGIPLSDFVLLPAIASLCLMMPILYLLGSFAAILGGLSVSTASLGFSAAGYLHETFLAVPTGDFVFGAAKSVAFAALIGVTSCRTGLKAARSAAAVGEAATRAVVTNIIGIIALDAVFAAIAGAYGL
ncbi:MAG: MlaE family ABC transporter permease [Steroidobacteraceae bacterium]